MRWEIESAFENAARATGRLSMILVRGRVTRSTLLDLANLLDLASERLKSAAEKVGAR